LAAVGAAAKPVAVQMRRRAASNLRMFEFSCVVARSTQWAVIRMRVQAKMVNGV
jgi:hypothetical protein